MERNSIGDGEDCPPAAETEAGEHAPFLNPPFANALSIVAGGIGDGFQNENEVIDPRQLRKLYLSHFISTWNSRTYEFAAVIFIVEAFPNTLLPASLSGILQCLTTLLFSPTVGRWADQSSSRLKSLRGTIIVQRLAVLLACLGWSILLWNGSMFKGQLWTKGGLMALIICLNAVERLAAGGNTVVMERDWVSTIASPQTDPPLHQLNASMRRIDLLCKVFAPGFVSILPLLFSRAFGTSASTLATAIAVAIMNVASPTFEWYSAQQVWQGCPALQRPKLQPPKISVEGLEVRPKSFLDKILYKSRSLAQFCRSAVCIPTISIALLYVSVLTFGTPMTTYLLNTGFSLQVVTVARIFSSILEVGATGVMPWGVKTIRDWKSPRPSLEDIDSSDIGEHGEHNDFSLNKAEVERTGLWGLWWMAGVLVPAAFSISKIHPSTSAEKDTIPFHIPSPVYSIPLLLSIGLSRVGLWTYDLAYSQLQQTLSPPDFRGEFTGIEQSFLAGAELLQWIMTAIVSKPEEFAKLAWWSWGTVLASAGLYAFWIRKRRGHLLHLTSMRECCKK